jgi:hypothetical protein
MLNLKQMYSMKPANKSLSQLPDIPGSLPVGWVGLTMQGRSLGVKLQESHSALLVLIDQIKKTFLIGVADRYSDVADLDASSFNEIDLVKCDKV